MEKRHPHDKDIYEIDHKTLNALANLIAKAYPYVEVYELMQELDRAVPVRSYKEQVQVELMPREAVLDANMKTVG